jgi:hypothetical protein
VMAWVSRQFRLLSPLPGITLTTEPAPAWSALDPGLSACTLTVIVELRMAALPFGSPKGWLKCRSRRIHDGSRWGRPTLAAKVLAALR